MIEPIIIQNQLMFVNDLSKTIKRGLKMKKALLVLLAIIMLLSVSACGNDNNTNDDTTNDSPSNTPYAETFVPFSPYEALDEETLAAIGADGFEGTDAEIAQQIWEWQQEHMYYIADPNDQSDISYPMRWNYMIPGIYPVKEMVTERLTNDGKIYGLCWDYAAIYCAIANSYGLETRVTALKKYMTDMMGADPSTKQGLSMQEYGLLCEKLEANDVSFTYGQIDRVAKETWVHYRAEVLLNGEWISMDRNEVTGEYKEGPFEVAPWDEGYNNVLLYAPSALENNVLDIEALAELLAYAPQSDFVGITDDAGNTQRAETFTDLFRGKGLVPYFNDFDQVAAFLNLPEDLQEELAEELAEIKDDYEAGTGKKYYMLADCLIYSDDTNENISATDYVRIYNAITGCDMTEDEFNDYIN